MAAGSASDRRHDAPGAPRDRYHRAARAPPRAHRAARPRPVAHAEPRHPGASGARGRRQRHPPRPRGSGRFGTNRHRRATCRPGRRYRGQAPWVERWLCLAWPRALRHLSRAIRLVRRLLLCHTCSTLCPKHQPTLWRCWSWRVWRARAPPALPSPHLHRPHPHTLRPLCGGQGESQLASNRTASVSAK